MLKELEKIDYTYKENSPSPSTIISNYPAMYQQEYYQDGPIINYYSILNRLNDDYYLHQYAGLKTETILDTDHVGYGIGAWASAITNKANTKIVGQFVTAEGIRDGVNSQLVGQEIDIKNHCENNAASYSQVGMQLVTIGEGDSTAALELISDWSSQWRHGILIDEGAISEDGTVLAVSQTQPMKIGIDLGNSSFSDAAIRIKNSEIIKFEPSDYEKENAAFMKLSEDGHFLLYAGSNGFAVKSNDGMKNLFRVDSEGNVFMDEGNVVLTSPNGSKYAIQVDDNGNLSTEAMN